MGKFERISARVDSRTYARIAVARKRFGFRGQSTALVGLAKVGLDMLEDTDKHSKPTGNTQYIAEMFDGLSNYERQPDGSVPVRKQSKRLNDYGER